MAHRSSFGVDLNASSYELHPSPKDSVDTLQGNYCSTIRFSDTLSSQILDFVNNHQCHHGMKIGTVQLTPDNGGKISFNAINKSLSSCLVSVTKESNINTEVYETEYDRPPSNAMFLRRKGFVHSKLIIKSALDNDRSIKIRNPNTHAKRATTTFKQVKKPQRILNNKRRREHSNNDPPNKRLKANITLSQAIGHILYLGDATFHTVRKIIASRTSLNASIDDIQSTLRNMAYYYEPNYRLKEDIKRSVNWKNSSVLTGSEKNKIMNNISKPQSTEEKYQREYRGIKDERTYTKYDEIYKEKLTKQRTFLNSVNDNQIYFKKMRALIKGEKDEEKKAKMKEQFRKIFEERAKNLKDMRNVAHKIGIELKVIKYRMDTYFQEQRQLQQKQRVD